MILIDIGITIAKLIGVILVVCIARAFQIHYRIYLTLRRLEKQGIESYPGNYLYLLFGPLVALKWQYEKLCKQ